jgi:hypothetical protein
VKGENGAENGANEAAGAAGAAEAANGTNGAANGATNGAENVDNDVEMTETGNKPTATNAKGAANANDAAATMTANTNDADRSGMTVRLTGTDTDAVMTETNNTTAYANKPTGNNYKTNDPNQMKASNKPTGDNDVEMTDSTSNRTTYNTDKSNNTDKPTFNPASSLQRMASSTSLTDPGAAEEPTETAGPTTMTEATAEPTAANETGNKARGGVSNPKIGGTPRKIFCEG